MISAALMLRNAAYNAFIYQRSLHFGAILLRQTIDYSKVPVLKEEDIEEQFVKGHGPGGQNVNKRSNCVLLKHIPTGLVVKCHQSRLLDKNRKFARDLLIEKLDQLANGEDSVAKQKKRIEEKKSSKNETKRRKMQELKAAWKEREQNDV
ncbi:mitochondrial translation release factor in rescue [Cloeon dipterum]|uniref:mitochondrial translation release factor in rescue n=1 Tax=Cloeon dipterum TaxID=197152 RepID=UPI00322011F9